MTKKKPEKPEKPARNPVKTRDTLRMQVKCMAQNNINSRVEYANLRRQMAALLDEALEIKRRIKRRIPTIRRIVHEISVPLEAYSQYLPSLISEIEKECELDWRMLQRGEFENYRQFLDAFIEHRKDFHLYTAKANRLSQDLKILKDIPLSWGSSSSDYSDNSSYDD